MTRKRAGRLSRRDAERTLTDPAGSGSALGTVLSSAAGPTRPAELRGEDAAAAAFHASRLAAPPATRDHYVSPTRLAGRATTRLIVATGAVLALGTGGLAVATGVQLDDLPGLTSDGTQSAAGPSDSTSDEPTSDVPSPSTSPTPDGQQGDGEGDESGRPDDGTSTGLQPETPTTPGDSTQPDPLAGRVLDRACRDLLHPGLERGHDDNLASLIEQAGGPDQVEAFCVNLLGAKPEKPSKPGKPDKPDKPSKPGRPDKPSKPGKPDKPSKPDKADKRGQSDSQKNHSRRGGPMTPG